MLTFVVADDHPLIREGVIRVLNQALDPITIHEASTGQATLDIVGKQEVDLLVLDLNLPDKPGLEVLREVKLFKPDLPVLILTLYPERQYAIRAFKAGASGYLTKESLSQELVKAVRKILDGGKYVTATLAEHLAEVISMPADAHESLSNRELEVLSLLGRGKTVSQIADVLCLSVNTISTYRARLLEKLNLQTTNDLIRYALDHKIVD